MQQYDESFNDPALQAYSEQYQVDQFGRPLFTSGTFIPLGINFVQETTVFREFGPLSGSTVRAAYEVAPKIGNTLTRQTADSRCPLLRATRRIGPAGAARPRVQELG